MGNGKGGDQLLDRENRGIIFEEIIKHYYLSISRILKLGDKTTHWVIN